MDRRARYERRNYSLSSRGTQSIFSPDSPANAACYCPHFGARMGAFLGVSVSISASFSLSDSVSETRRNFWHNWDARTRLKLTSNLTFWVFLMWFYGMFKPIFCYLFGWSVCGFHGEVNCCLITLRPLKFPGSKQLVAGRVWFFLRTKRSLAQILIFSLLANSTRKSQRMNGQKFMRFQSFSFRQI